MQKAGVVVLILSIFELTSRSSSSLGGEQIFRADGKVLELDDSNFDSAISSFDFILVDFYAPWCGHCKRLSPQLDAAAPLLGGLKEPIVIAKVNADKFTRLREKYDVDAFPMLKIFVHGVPTDYYGPRKADLLVRYLKKFVAPDVSILDSDSAIKEFVEAAGTFFPIFIGFGLNESLISKLAVKYKRKAWFSVAKDFSEDVMVSYDFDKVPALVSILPAYDNEQNIFYGPFEDQYLEEFIKQSFFPLVVPINYDTLKLLKEEERKIVLALVEDEEEDNTKKLIKLLKAGASANRDLIFGYVGIKQWQDFAETFKANRKTPLPKLVVWDGNEEYLSVIGCESIMENNQAMQVSKFLEGYREGRTVEHRIAVSSFLGYINSLIGIGIVFIIVFMVGILMVIRTIRGEDEPPRVGTGPAQRAGGSLSELTNDEYRTGEKED